MCRSRCWPRRSARAPTGCASWPWGAASRRWTVDRPLPKSVGREITFADDTNELGLLRATLLSLADSAVDDLRRKGLAARTVAVKVRFNTFHTVGRRRTLARPVSATRPVHEAAVELLDELGIGARWVRLVGVGLSNLTHNAFQLTLDESWREAALGEAVDKVRAKYGFKALALAGGALSGGRPTHSTPALAFHPGSAASTALEIVP